MTDQKLEMLLKQTLSPEISDEEIKLKCGLRKETTKMKIRSLKKAGIIAAAACLLVGTTVFAAGKITSTVTGHNRTEFSDFSKINKAMDKAGFKISVVEDFSNGYSFSKATVQDTKGLDDEYNEVMSYNQINVEYVNESGNKLALYAMETVNETSNSEVAPASEESREIEGVTVNYYVYHYKFVPLDYELTEEDKANMEASNYEISYGSDEVEEIDMANLVWEKDGIRYDLLDYGKNEKANNLFGMVEELLK